MTGMVVARALIDAKGVDATVLLVEKDPYALWLAYESLPNKPFGLPARFVAESKRRAGLIAIKSPR